MLKNLPGVQETWVQSLVRKMPWRKKWQPTPVFLPGEFHGLRSLADYGPWGSQEFYLCYKQIDHLGVLVQKPKPKWYKYDWRYSKNQAEIIIYLTLYCDLKIRSRRAHKASYRAKAFTMDTRFLEILNNLLKRVFFFFFCTLWQRKKLETFITLFHHLPLKIQTVRALTIFSFL